MQLLRLGPYGSERPAVRTDDGILYDLSPVTRDIDGAFLNEDGVARARSALAAGTLTRVDSDGRRIGAPVARPGAVVCIGLNYAAHAAESDIPPPEAPVVFLKHPNTVVGPYDDIRAPSGASRLDWEVELAVVIGRRARYLDSPEAAAGCVAGYAVANDVSEREFQLEHSGGQWSKGKCCETFNPLGPWLVPADEVRSPQGLGLRSWVNGEVRQDSSTGDMIFGVHHLVRHLSRYMVLDPGDVVITGTPEGVALSGRFGYLAAGDTVRMEIDGLGVQEQRVVSTG
ncbi:fumarylacetoacetate hydrolase family protein [Allosalinactinospora lopnorensis]|uniref:fumarylacetoacetate hydrolase family protein n=1 Tax=Allosalinactinospora lopnorensis TaxID=1352348 RepID=UPI000623DADA|nr:fumarylacetoacetate hydrolase family protein [Allosalinactinospora lopnorensis]